jgi:hypothetical protein
MSEQEKFVADEYQPGRGEPPYPTTKGLTSKAAESLGTNRDPE